ncbi:MAG: T9SS type A sorting domain-containing protein [Flavobacteriales bacterium]
MVIDIFGKVVQDFGSQERGEIDLTSLSQGTYIIKANSKKGKVINRVIIR